jgi:hypothetical protein
MRSRVTFLSLPHSSIILLHSRTIVMSSIYHSCDDRRALITMKGLNMHTFNHPIYDGYVLFIIEGLHYFCFHFMGITSHHCYYYVVVSFIYSSYYWTLYALLPLCSFSIGRRIPFLPHSFCHFTFH